MVPFGIASGPLLPPLLAPPHATISQNVARQDRIVKTKKYYKKYHGTEIRSKTPRTIWSSAAAQLYGLNSGGGPFFTMIARW